MNIRTRRGIARTLQITAIVMVTVTVIFLAVICVPLEYRSSLWRNLPAIDRKLLPHVSAVFAAAFGAFFGSASAFYLGRVQQRLDRREKRHAAAIAAQYALMSQWNVVEGIRVQQLEEFRADPSRFAKIRLQPFHPTPTFVPFAEMTSVLEQANPNLLQEIHLAEQSYHACIDALEVRNAELRKFYENPRVSHQILDLRTGAGVSAASARDTLFLRQATDGLYDTVDRALPRLVEATEKLEKLMKNLFPEKQALRMTPDESARPNAATD